MSHWTDTDYKHVFNAVHSNSFSQYNEAYNRVSGSTMIEKDNEDRYFLHRAVRAGIYEDPDYPAEVKSASLTAILDLYATRAKEVNNPGYYFDRIIELIRSHASYGEHFSEDDTKLLRDAVYYNLAYFYALGAGRIKEMNAVFDEYLDFLCYSELSKAHILGVKWTMLNYLDRYSDPVYTDGYSCSVYEKVYGPDHPDTLSCLHGMAESHKNNGRYSEALHYAEELCRRTERLFGREDNRNLNALDEMAGICGRLKMYAHALQIYQDIYDISRSNNNGEENGFSISALEGIARIHKDRNEYKDALEMGKRVCAYYVNEYGEFNPNTIRSYNDLAVTYAGMGDNQTA